MGSLHPHQQSVTTSASLFSWDITPVALVSCARSSGPGSHPWGGLADGSSKRGEVLTPPARQRGADPEQGSSLWAPLSTCAFNGQGARRCLSSREPPPPSWSSPHHTDLTCRMRALPALISEPGPSRSMWGLVCCCQKGFVGWALIVNRNSLKCT